MLKIRLSKTTYMMMHDYVTYTWYRPGLDRYTQIQN